MTFIPILCSGQQTGRDKRSAVDIFETVKKWPEVALRGCTSAMTLSHVVGSRQVGTEIASK